MPEGAVPASARRFASDLRRIREARGVTLEELHDETKIPPNLLEAFEETALVDHEMFNRVYLRSLVRTYAQVVGLAPEGAQQALEDALDDRYRGALAHEYLGEPLDPEPEPPAAAEAATPPAAPPAPEEAPPKEKAPPQGKPPPKPKAPPSPTPPAPHTSPPGATPPRTPAQPAARRVDRPAPTPSATGRTWLYIALSLAALAVVIWLLSSLFEGEPETAAPAPAPPDTVAAAATPPPEPPRPAITLGDTLFLTVVAEQGPVQRLLITRDDDLRRPYWIDEGTATVFPFTRQIILEQPEQLDKSRLLLQDYAYPTSARDAQGRIVIARETARAFADTLRGDPAVLAAPVDTQWAAVPQTP